MQCPSCGGALVKQDYGITVDECERCRGMWFERDELRRAKDSSDPNLRWLDFDVFAGSLGSDPTQSERTCPRCSQPMRSLEYMHSKVQVDVCDQQDQEHGVWLDSGEFQKIIAYLEQLVDTMDVGDYERAALTKLKEIVTGPESHLSEVKDFLAAMRLLERRVSVEHSGSVDTLSRLSRLLP